MCSILRVVRCAHKDVDVLSFVLSSVHKDECLDESVVNGRMILHVLQCAHKNDACHLCFCLTECFRHTGAAEAVRLVGECDRWSRAAAGSVRVCSCVLLFSVFFLGVRSAVAIRCRFCKGTCLNVVCVCVVSVSVCVCVHASHTCS